MSTGDENRGARSPSPEEVLAALKRSGADAMSFLALESGMRHFVTGPGAGRGCVAYVDTGSAWVAAAGPIADPAFAGEVARAFVGEARRAGRRACFFATEGAPIEGFARLLLGEQPVWVPAEWPRTVAAHRRLREQIRRARSKGVRVRRASAEELSAGAPLRARCDALAREWLAARHMAPMAFVVALEPFAFPEEHRYFVAEREGELVAFLSAVPVYAAGGWLVEDLPRSARAPNGTVEVLVDALMREVPGDAFVTLGLAPLAGPVSVWLRVARFAGRPLYDFRGLRRFKARLRPARWQPVWLAYPRSETALVHLVESLRAFAGGSLLGFGLRTLALQPSAPPWALALPLVPWTLLLAAIVVTGRSELLGFSAGALMAWVVFDALLFVQLLRSALRPRPLRLAGAAVPALADAALSLASLVTHGLGPGVLTAGLRITATAAPCVGALVLTWATLQAVRRA